MTLHSIVQQADQQGLVVPFWVWRVSAQAHCGKYFFHAGYYDLADNESIYTLVERICRGKARLGHLTIAEGGTWKMLRQRLDSLPDVEHDVRHMTDQDILLALHDNEHVSLEGLLFPDTYNYSPGESDFFLLQRAHLWMLKKLDDFWNGRDKQGVPLHSPYGLLIIASMIEKEVHLPDERGQVASVFYNRLRNGMLLQSDPSVCYDSHCTKNRAVPIPYDLLNLHPHNTYRHSGLPPTPICFPSGLSLAAAARPDKTNYYYFVAKGDGSSYFSHSLPQHNRAVRRFLTRYRRYH